MKALNIISIISLAMALSYCSKASDKDPETNDLGEFNPPSQLQTLTRDEKLFLTWIGGNAEDDFQGYQVFGTTTSMDDLADLVVYPSGASIDNAQSIPRCKDNSAFFEKFGFPATTADCESSVLDEDDGFFGSGAVANGGLGYILEEDSDAEETLSLDDFRLTCTGGTTEGSGVSLSPASDAGSIGRQYCLVSQAWDPDADTPALVDVENGTTYTYIVVAVKGSDKNEISWISNVVDDTPAELLFNEAVTLGTEKYRSFAINFSSFADVTAGDATDCGSTNICAVANTNAESTDAVYIGRDDDGGSFDTPQRFFVSVNSGSSMQLAHRGRAVSEDPTEEDTDTYQKPGDEAVTDGYQTAGKKFAFVNKAVFDIRYDTGSDDDEGNDIYNYGKIAITNVGFSDGDITAEATLDVAIIVQSTTNETNYLK